MAIGMYVVINKKKSNHSCMHKMIVDFYLTCTYVVYGNLSTRLKVECFICLSDCLAVGLSIDVLKEEIETEFHQFKKIIF